MTHLLRPAFALALAALALPTTASAAPPTLTGHAGEGLTQTCSPATTGSSYDYEWIVDPGAFETVVDGTEDTTATTDTHTFTGEEVGHEYVCRVWTDDVDFDQTPERKVPYLLRFTRYGRTVSGDVGGGLSGTNTVTVRLRRDDVDGFQPDDHPIFEPRVVDTATATIDNVTGEWSATFADHAPADDRDALNIDYGGPAPGNGSGLPPDTNRSLVFYAPNPDVNLFSGPAQSLSADGATLTAGCPLCTHVTAAVNGGAPVDVTSPHTFSPVLTEEDDVRVTFVSHLDAPAAPVRVAVETRAPLPGASEAPRCHVDYVAQQTVTCAPVPDGIATELVQSGSPQAGDEIELRTDDGRTLTTLHVAPLRLDIGETTSGECGAGLWFAAEGAFDRELCPESGTATALNLAGATIALQDDLSGGETRVSVPAPIPLSPLDGATVASAQLEARATASPLLPATIAFGYRPAGTTGAFTAVAGDAPAPPVGDYEARWLLTDSHGDTRALATTFTQADPPPEQGEPVAGGGDPPPPPPPEPGDGPSDGPSRPSGPAEPTAAPRVTCRLRRARGGRRRLTCRITLARHTRVMLRLSRNGRVVAVGRRTGTGTLTIRLRQRRRVRRGAYTLAVLVAGAPTRRIPVRLR